MKKISIIFLIMVMTVIALTGCNKTDENTDNSNKVNVNEILNNVQNTQSAEGSSTNWQGIEWSKVDKEPIIMATNDLSWIGIIGEDRNSNLRNLFDLPSKIKKVTILDTTIDEAPEDYLYTWDISKEEDGSVNAWLVETSRDEYELYYGGDYGIILNDEVTSIAGRSNAIFKDFKNCTEIVGLDKIDTSRTKSLMYMFHDCEKIKELDLSSWKTYNVETISYMFENCKSLTKLNLSSFNTENVVSMNKMFGNCSSLKNLDLSAFNTEKVKYAKELFSDCSSLEKLNLENFNTQKVKSMHKWFYNCSNLESLDLGSFNTEDVEDMSGMFYNCNKLKSLDLSNFNTSNVKNMYAMFENCTALSKLDVKNLDTKNVVGNGKIFEGCNSLRNKDSLLKFENENMKNFEGKVSYYAKETDGTLKLDVDVNLGEVSVGDTIHLVNDENKIISAKVVKLRKDYFGDFSDSLNCLDDKLKQSELWIEKSKADEFEKFISKKIEKKSNGTYINEDVIIYIDAK